VVDGSDSGAGSSGTVDSRHSDTGSAQKHFSLVFKIKFFFFSSTVFFFFPES